MSEHITTQDIDINKIYIANDRIRKELDKPESPIDDLAASLNDVGLLHPIVVQPYTVDGVEYYKLIAGERRITAARSLGWQTIRASIHRYNLTDDDLFAIELVENTHRLDLTWDERIKAEAGIDRIMTNRRGRKTLNNPDGWDQKSTARLIRKSPASISRAKKLATVLEAQPDLALKFNSAADLYKVIQDTEEQAMREAKREAFLGEQAESADLRVQQMIKSYVVGDFFDIVPELSDNHYHLVFIDPPFGIDLNTIRVESKSSKLLESDDYKEVSREEYPVFLWNVLNTALPKIHPTEGWGVLFFGWEWWSLTEHYLKELEKAKLIDFGIPIPGLWIKKSGQTRVPHRYMPRSTQPFFYFRRYGSKARLAMNRSCDYFEYRKVYRREGRTHRTEIPIELYDELLTTFTHPGSSILDCFTGSGNLILAAANCECECIGVDLSTDNKKDFEVRAYSDKFGEYKSYRHALTESEVREESIANSILEGE